MAKQVNLLPLTSDYIFHTLFTESKESLIDLINTALDFQGKDLIKDIKIQSGEIPKETKDEKLSILDIKAQSLDGRLYNIEMQAFSQKFYLERILYYWAKLYSRQLKEGDPYTKLSNTYSINFLDFQLLEAFPNYKNTFLLLEKDHPHLPALTDRLQIIFFELPKFKKDLSATKDKLDLWMYSIKNSVKLDRNQMETIEEKNPIMAEAFSTLRRLSMDPEISGEAAQREKALKDYNTNMLVSYEEGMEKGIEKEKKESRKERRKEIEKAKKEMAQRMLDEGYAMDDVLRITGLTQDQLNKPKLL